MPVIAVENLKYRYPNTESLALDGLSFTVEKGEFIGIVGENGAGKSTLSQALIGLVPQFYKGAYGGRVLIEDLPALGRKHGLETDWTSFADDWRGLYQPQMARDFRRFLGCTATDWAREQVELARAIASQSYKPSRAADA